MIKRISVEIDSNEIKNAIAAKYGVYPEEVVLGYREHLGFKNYYAVIKEEVKEENG